MKAPVEGEYADLVCALSVRRQRRRRVARARRRCAKAHARAGMYTVRTCPFASATNLIIGARVLGWQAYASPRDADGVCTRGTLALRGEVNERCYVLLTTTTGRGRPCRWGTSRGKRTLGTAELADCSRRRGGGSRNRGARRYIDRHCAGGGVIGVSDKISFHLARRWAAESGHDSSFGVLAWTYDDHCVRTGGHGRKASSRPGAVRPVSTACHHRIPHRTQCADSHDGAPAATQRTTTGKHGAGREPAGHRSVFTVTIYGAGGTCRRGA